MQQQWQTGTLARAQAAAAAAAAAAALVHATLVMPTRASLQTLMQQHWLTGTLRRAAVVVQGKVKRQYQDR
jgi:hypothetical protein